MTRKQLKLARKRRVLERRLDLASVLPPKEKGVTPASATPLILRPLIRSPKQTGGMHDSI